MRTPKTNYYEFRKLIYTNKRELLHVLIDYAYLTKKDGTKSRTLYVDYNFVENDMPKMRTIEFTFFFDADCQICGMREKEQVAPIEYNPKPVYKKYRLYSFEFMDTTGEPYETREQVIEELKIHAGHKYTLAIDGVKDRIHVRYEDGILFCDNKPYKI